MTRLASFVTLTYSIALFFGEFSHMSKIALLFPGQGAQESGMGRALAEHSSEAMDLWKKAENISKLPLREIYWDGDDLAMSDTKALQPALTVVNLALWQAVAGRFSPMCTAGHSLGEYASLGAAKALSFEKILELVTLRGRLMAEADPHGVGAMAAILKLELGKVQELVTQSLEQCAGQDGEMLRIANYNTPGQFVLSGTKHAMDLALVGAKEMKGRGIALKVSGAFHSPLMSEAAAELAPVLQKAEWKKPIMPIYCNVHGKAVQDADLLRECMVAQMTSSVQWIDTMQAQHADGMDFFLEVGPKAVLSKMVAPCLAPLGVESPRTACVTNYDQEVEL